MTKFIFISAMALLLLGSGVSLFKSIQEGGRWVLLCLLTGTLAYAIHCWRESKLPLVSLLGGVGLLIVSSATGP